MHVTEKMNQQNRKAEPTKQEIYIRIKEKMNAYNRKD